MVVHLEFKHLYLQKSLCATDWYQTSASCLLIALEILLPKQNKIFLLAFTQGYAKYKKFAKKEDNEAR
jgi:hypothetical protein